MLNYVFDHIIQRYQRLKRSTDKGKKGLAQEQKPDEPSGVEDVDANVAQITSQHKVSIIDTEDIERRLKWYNELKEAGS